MEDDLFASLFSPVDDVADHPVVFPAGENIRHPPRKGITCGGVWFRNQEDLKNKVREQVISKYGNYKRFSLEDLQFVVNVLSLSKDGCHEKIGGGVVAGWIEPNERYNPSGLGVNRTIHLKRRDGITVDVSWIQAISPPTPEAEAKRAMRMDVDNAILAWKESQFLMKGDEEGCLMCPVMGVPVDPLSSEVHHASPSFKDLVSDFIRAHAPGGLASIETESVGNLKTGVTIKDPFIRGLWINYHNSNAKLQILSKEGHRQITLKGKSNGGSCNE